MTDMWNNVKIANPGTITIESLDGVFTGDGQMWEMVGVDALPDGSIEISGGSKYQADDLIEAITELSTKNPEATITHSEEWTGEYPENTVTVVRAGGMVVGESSESMMVPANLRELVHNLRAAIASGTLAIHDDGLTRFPMQDAACALADALYPIGASK